MPFSASSTISVSPPNPRASPLAAVLPGRKTSNRQGSRMKGGSILVLGPVGKSVGLGIRRGTIVLGQRPGEVPRPQHQATSAMKPDEHEN